MHRNLCLVLNEPRLVPHSLVARITQVMSSLHDLYTLWFAQTFNSGSASLSLENSQSAGSTALPEVVLKTAQQIASGAALDPSPGGLQVHISDLETELRTTEFRLHFFYHQRANLLNMIAEAKQQLDKLNK